MTEPAPIISVSNLEKVFRDFWNRPKVKAVNKISFEVQPGEVFGLLGPNGSGKSTTIKMMLGLLNCSGGEIRILGNHPRHVQTKAKIGYLPEESYLYSYLNARETLNFYGKLFDLNAAERKERINQLLKMVGLENTGRRMVGEFSKGMARRVGLAQALINDPEIVILDEPTSGLDPLGTRQVKDLILALAARGKTVILSSHLLADVEDVCDRVAILYGGQIRAMGPVHELLQLERQHEIRLPADLAPDVLERVLSRLREEIGSEPEVRHPTRNLEQYFLEVVEKARSESAETSGASAAEGVADYLSPDENKPDEAVLDALTNKTPIEEPTTPAPEKPPEPSAEEVDDRLENLLKKPEDKN
jgi:ABC-2 type transport system ATP-binding protein